MEWPKHRLRKTLHWAFLKNSTGSHASLVQQGSCNLIHTLLPFILSVYSTWRVKNNCKMTSFAEKSKDLHATFQKCLASPEPFADDAEKESCRRMVEALPEDLVVHAANTSYAYWYLSRSPESAPSEEVKIAMAMREARRHLNYMGDYDSGLKNMIESLEYRKVRVSLKESKPHPILLSDLRGSCFTAVLYSV